MIEGIKNKILNRKFIVNSAIVATGATIGGVLGVEKNKLNAGELDIILTKEYGKCLEKIKNNISSIEDSIELTKQNQLAKDIFNSKCAKGYELLKKTNKINIALGIILGAGVGVLGVILKSKIFKGKKNGNNSDKKQSLNIQS